MYTCEHTKLLYIGTRLKKGEPALEIVRFDSQKGTIEEMESIDTIDAPTFVIRHPKFPLLYAMQETETTEGEPGGAVVAIPLESTLDAHTSVSKPMGSGGSYPCHLHIDKEGSTLFVSNYGNGVFTVFSLDAEGYPEEIVQKFSFEGKGYREDRQECSHIHSSLLSPDEKYIFVADLGLDRIIRYSCDKKPGSPIHLSDPKHFPVAKGSGPRHMHFSRDNRYLYVVEELSNEVSVFSYGSEDGNLTLIQTISTLEEGQHEPNTAADIHLSEDGTHLYVSNRGYDTIAMYQVDLSCGKLRYTGGKSSHGTHPRNFTLDDQDGWLLVANADDDAVVVCPISKGSGAIEAPVHLHRIYQPVCLCWA